MKKYFTALVTHSQITVYQSGLNEFNEWDRDHTDQGFSWRTGNVSFGLPDIDEETLVMISDEVNEFEIDVDKAERIIDVPFVIKEGVIIGTTYDDFEFNLNANDYQLRFALYKDFEYEGIRYNNYVLLLFKPTDDAIFKITKKGGEMTTDNVLKITANVAK